MSSRVTKLERPLAAPDGRHARAERTRIAVAEAMLDCFEDGLLRPGADEVASRAGVSRRAVFRHFDNMEALVGEAANLQFDRVTGRLPSLIFEGTREERVDSLVARATRTFELTRPVRRAATLCEPFSETIRERYTWMRTEMRSAIRRAFGDELAPLSEAARRDRIAALRALLSFHYWDELRRHERLSVATATRTLTAAIHRLLQA